jgi:hypothetical protein
MSHPFEIGKVYTFNTIAPGILQATVKNAKMMAALDYETAKMYENIDLKFRQIYPVLPSGTPNTPEACVYFRFQTESGEKIILADLWINESTIDTIEHINIQVTLVNGSLQDITRIRNAMNALGYMNQFTIQQI